MVRHTPGPWDHFDFENIYAHGQNVPGRTRVVACTFSVEGFGGFSEQIANTRLIAAAPELLAALKALYEATPDNEEGDLGDACRQARAAIFKAEGKS
jgi:hypothetical protein